MNNFYDYCSYAKSIFTYVHPEYYRQHFFKRVIEQYISFPLTWFVGKKMLTRHDVSQHISLILLLQILIIIIMDTLLLFFNIDQTNT